MAIETQNNTNIELNLNEVQVVDNSKNSVTKKNSESKLFIYLKLKFEIRNKNLIFVVLCLCIFTQNMIISGANNANLTTIERIFYMSSLESAFFLITYDIANIITSPFIGYFGDHGSKTKFIGFGMMGLSLGSFVMIIPKLLTLQTNFDTSLNRKEIECINNTSNFSKISSIHEEPKNSIFINNLKYIFYLANSINGISSVTLYTAAISYIENIFAKEQIHIRQGIYYVMGAFGVGFGAIVSGNLLKIKDKKLLNIPIEIADNTDFKMIGAWWIVYCVTSVFCLFLSVICLLFSTSLAQKNPPKTFDESQIKIKDHLKQLIEKLKNIFTSPIILFILICMTSETFILKGLSFYLTKYFEYEYRLESATAAIIAGSLALVSVLGGSMLGAFLVKHFKWGLKKNTKFLTTILFSTVILFPTFIIYCPQEIYINDKSIFYKKSKCNCDANNFQPVCFKNYYMFQTPCHAGCTFDHAKNIYTECTVLNSLLHLNNQSGIVIHTCAQLPQECKMNLILVCIFIFIVLFLSSLIFVPFLRILIESVSEENQSFVLGIRSFITKLFGNIPGPILFALIVENSCIQWTKSLLTESTSCSLYNNRLFSLGLGILGTAMRLFSACSALIALYFVSHS